MTKEKGRQWDGKSRISNDTYRKRWKKYLKKKNLKRRKMGVPKRLTSQQIKFANLIC